MPRGIYIRTEEAKKNMSISHKGKPSSWKGKHPTEESRQKMRNSHLGQTPWNKRKKCPKTAGEKNYFYGKRFTGKNNPSWKGGGYHNKNKGYIFIYCPEHPRKDYRNYVLEHRVIMEKHLGRYLLPSEIVHHKNGNKADNRIENLQLFSNHSEHLRFIHTKIECPFCHKIIPK